MDGNTDNQTTQKTNKELQDELVSLGMPREDAEKIKTSSVLLSVISTLKLQKQTPSQDSQSSQGDSVQPQINPAEERQIDKSWKAKTRKQWDFWDASPKVDILVPLTGREKQGVVRWVFDKSLGRDIPLYVEGAVQPVTENGAQYLIPKGVYVKVPQPVAKIIQDKFKQTSEAGANIKSDRLDPSTGRPVAEML